MRRFARGLRDCTAVRLNPFVEETALPDQVTRGRKDRITGDIYTLHGANWKVSKRRARSSQAYTGYT